MVPSALTPVFRGLRTGLHLLFAALTLLVVMRALFTPVQNGVIVILLALIFLATYGAGVLIARTAEPNANTRSGTPGRTPGVLLWLAALLLEWGVLLWLIPEAAYLVFPLFFLFFHLLGSRYGAIAIVVLTAIATCTLGLHSGWTLGGVIGPLVGASVALLIGYGYRAISRETEEREALMRELVATRDQLAASERESGVLAERARLAREIHDTVAQGLSSIQILLHAAERADPESAGMPHILLARETAAVNLDDARRFIRELTPPELDDQGLGGALRRLATGQWAQRGLKVNVKVSDTVTLPMHLQTALLRISQGAIANVMQHAQASKAEIELALDAESLRFTVSDDGIGFDPTHTAAGTPGTPDSFGLRATAERVEQLGGSLTIDSGPGRGTTLIIDLTLKEAP